MTELTMLSVDELADGICLRAGRIAVAQAELLQWIGEFDRREGWAGPGMLSCAHWLSWRIGTALGTARDQVRVARRLPDLPAVAAAFADGQVSYSKVRAITRVAAPDDGIDWVALARHSSAAQLDALVRGMSRARAHDTAQTDPEQAAWRLRTRVRYDTDGSFVLTVRGPAQLLPVIRAGLDARKRQLRREAAAGAAGAAGTVADLGAAARAEAAWTEADDGDLAADPPRVAQPDAGPPDEGPPDEGPPDEGPPDEETPATAPPAADPADVDARVVAPPAGDPPAADPPAVAPPVRGGAAQDDPPAPTDADALLALAQDALQTEHDLRPDTARRRRWQLTAQLDPRSGWARQPDGELLPPSSLSAVLKTLPGRGGVLRLRRLTAADLRRHDLGRSTRQVSDGLRELLSAVDGEHCRFPGCTRRRNLHAHHVQFWRHGGRTDLANLVLVCSRHHTVLHSRGFQLQLHPDRRLDVTTSAGAPVPHTPAPAQVDPGPLLHGRDVSAETLPPDHTDPRLDLRYAIAVLLGRAA